MAIKRVGIVGSGIMGAGIAEVAALHGFEVVVRSRSREAADRMKESVEKSLTKQVEKEKLSGEERDGALQRLSTATEMAELDQCDLVIESVVEDLSIKQEIFAELDRVCPEHAILATNTSTLPVVEMAIVTNRPQSVCGIHFFNPAPVMSLVEVVRPITASDETISKAMTFAHECDKSPVEVKDQAGFIVNALLFPYLNNAVRLLENRTATLHDIDTAMKGGCGFPMGPFALLDLVGLDTSVAILDALYGEFRDPNFAPVPLLRRMVAAGHVGRKSGKGFYDYES
jgi:3-hydroxybutyryl-CoA dehydrogenase